MSDASTGLVEVRKAMAVVADAFDPALLSATDASRAVDEAAAIEKMAAVVKALAAKRVADAGLWRRRGARSAADDLAQRTGTTVGAAIDALNTAGRLGEQPEVAAAARRGELSPTQAAVISDAAAADPSAAPRLLALAQKSSVGELRTECARTKAAADPDPDATYRRIHARRRHRTFTDAEGGWNSNLRHTPDVGAKIMAKLAPLRDKFFCRARADGRTEPLEAYAADALVAALLGEEAVTGAEHMSGVCEGSGSVDSIGQGNESVIERAEPVHVCRALAVWIVHTVALPRACARLPRPGPVDCAHGCEGARTARRGVAMIP